MVIDNFPPSDFRLEIEVRAGYIYAYVEGSKDSLEISINYWKRLFEECAEKGIPRLLVEENLGENLSAAETFSLASELPKLAKGPVKVAFVDRFTDHDDLNQFGEMVASNRGLRVRVFPDAAEAERWLADSGSGD